ncbi:hypothetical protein ACFSSA_00940 [Luteolibacter algae]|uniref:SH3 domain-containing protein n=1 Tax=Luteolibacter algae TaxID=454151 RepID=A0ABW5D4K5_9BACT
MNLLSLSIAPIALAIVACETMNAPISSSSFDPLRPPGSSSQSSNSSYGPEYSPGQFVSATIDNTAFYKDKPKDNQDADKLLARGTQMKIVSADSSYVKVELDSGEVGYVPSVMVSTGAAPEVMPLDGAYQVYPPLPNTGGPLEPLPIVDPNGLPPEGAIPAIIDPDAPIVPVAPTLDPVPDLKPVEEAPAPTAGEALDATTDAAKEAAADATEDAADELKEKTAPAGQ